MLIPDNEQTIERLKAFICKWAGPAKPEYGLKPREIPADLPAALQELYRFAGNWPNPAYENSPYPPAMRPRLFEAQDIWMGAGELRREADRITFLLENQGSWSCQVDANREDSPVYSDAARLWDDRLEEPEIVCPSLSHFMTTFCLQELVFGSLHFGKLEGSLDPAVFRDTLHPIWLDGYYVFKEPSHSFYLCGNDLLIMDYYSDVWYGCLDDRALSLIADPSMVKPIEP
ncbi:hypothetical protein QWJ34_13955 [Saccharibacillus sp. CPCC 101409]|uniref:hypothetical protein n=1 Tax=Saccharibacillus sp. CPCC 101409 TaxID=3058041 RepID=UPI0026728D6B|nr:hypothetical protein [Saccharibacillus sp. CPCC 101409]MDO3410872.1 hypothetical protein [Saccharibacillus sp. CPCC 101409]